MNYDFLRLRHPRAGKPRQTKLYLSQEIFDRLHSASQLTGLDMSAIVDNLLRQTLPEKLPEELTAEQPGTGEPELPLETPAPPKNEEFSIDD